MSSSTRANPSGQEGGGVPRLPATPLEAAKLLDTAIRLHDGEKESPETDFEMGPFPSVGRIAKTDMPDDRYLAALKRFRTQIAEGLELEYLDSTAMGDKDTNCSWGLCSDRKESWPDATDHVWLDGFIERGRVAPRRLQRWQLCPMDSEADEQGRKAPKSPLGCHARCRIFKGRNDVYSGPRGRKLPRLPSRQEVLSAYDAAITRVEQALEARKAATNKPISEPPSRTPSAPHPSHPIP